MSNTQVFLAHKDNGLPLVVDELDNAAVAVLAIMVLGAQIRQLIFALLHVVVNDPSHPSLILARKVKGKRHSRVYSGQKATQ